MKIKNLLVTGATSALANSLIGVAAQKGNYRLLAVSRGEQQSINLDGFIECSKLIEIDFTKDADLETLTEYTRKFFIDKFDVVHFAGDFWRHKPLICTDFDEIKSMVSSHYISLCGVAKSITPLMIKNGGGRLVAFSCNSVGYNYPDMSPFTAAKAAVESFIKCYANEQAPYGVSASVIALPTMKTREILIEKPNGDHDNYIEPDNLADFILDHVLAQPVLATGNIMRLISPSPTFYGKGYFERNPRKEEHNKAIYLAASRP